MRARRAVLILSLLAGASAQGATASFLPPVHIERFVVENFDIGSIRSSLGPRRKPGDRHFADLGIKVLQSEAGHVVLGSDGWRYDIRILQRGDINADGIEDLAVCFTDDGKGAGGSYYTVEPLLLTRYASDGPLIAISYSPVVRGDCRTRQSRNAP